MSAVAELDYVEGPGPGIPDLSQPPAAGEAQREPPPRDEQQAALELAAYPGFEQGTIEQFLKGAGAGMHMLAGAGDRDWLMTEKDLERIAPPLTRILNRWEPAVRLSPMADPLLVAEGVVIYGWRSMIERQRALRDAQQALERQDRYESAPAQPSANGAGAPPQGEPEEGPPRYFDTRREEP